MIKPRLIAALALLCATPGMAQTPAATLPGGASSLQETFDDWRVVCMQQGNAPRCSASQQQARNDGQRVLGIELFTDLNANQLKGTLILPFGLALDQGVSLSEADKALGDKLRFSTCVPAGCLVPLAFGAATLAILRKGTSLKVSAAANDGAQPVNLTVSLKGLAQALDRIKTIMK